MIKRWLWVALLVAGMQVAVGCGSNDGSDDDGDGDGSDESGAFMVPRASNSSGIQMARDASGVIHFVGSPTLVENGHAPLLYGRCASNCGSASSWTYLNINDGFTSDMIGLAVEPSGTVHVALLGSGQVTFGQCAQRCTDAAASTWQFQAVTAPSQQVWQFLPKGRSFTVSSTGLERLAVNGQSNGTTSVILIAKGPSGFVADPLLTVHLRSVQVMAKGDGVEMVGALDDFDYSLGYLACAGNCHDVAQYAGDVFTQSNTTLVGAARDSGGVLHAVHATSLVGGNDVLTWSRCTTNCGTPGSWQHVGVGDGNDGRGALDLAVQANGSLAIATTPAVSLVYQAVSLRTCAAGCNTSSDWTAAKLIDGSGTIHDAAPSDTHEVCDNPSRTWGAGDHAQIVPSANGFLLGYDAAIYSRCALSEDYYTIGRYIRLSQQ